MNREYSVSIVATNWVSVQASSEDEAAEKALSLGVFETLDGADYNVVSISGPEDQPPPEPPKTKSVRIRFTRTETFTRDIEIGEELFDQNYNEEDLCRDIYYQLREEDDLFVGQIPDDCDEKVELLKEEECECGLDEQGKWRDEVFDRYGCECGTGTEAKPV